MVLDYSTRALVVVRLSSRRVLDYEPLQRIAGVVMVEEFLLQRTGFAELQNRATQGLSWIASRVIRSLSSYTTLGHTVW